MTLNLMLTYALPTLLLCAGTLMLRRRRETRAVAALHDSVNAGLTEPASLHPIIDPIRCLGCGNCTLTVSLIPSPVGVTEVITVP